MLIHEQCTFRGDANREASTVQDIFAPLDVDQAIDFEGGHVSGSKQADYEGQRKTARDSEGVSQESCIC